MNEDKLSEILDNFESETRVNSMEANASVEVETVKEMDYRGDILIKLKSYEDNYIEIEKYNKEKEALMEKLREACPDIYSEIDKINEEIKGREEELSSITSDLLPLYQRLINLDADNKTLAYGRVQGTYVYPTKKHQFDLKSFIANEHDFYLDNISTFNVYSKITDVSDYVKITIKKPGK